MFRRVMPRRSRGPHYPLSAAAPARSIVTLDTLTASNFYSLAGSSALAGTSSMTMACVVRAKVSSPLTTDFRFISKTASNGYRHAITSASSGSVQGIAVNGTPSVISETVAVTGIVAGSFYTMAVRLGSSLLDVFWGGAQVGAPGATCVGYTPTTSAQTLEVGKVASGSSNWELAAVVIAESTAVSDLDIAAWHAQVAAANTWTFPGGGTTHVWYAGDADAGGGVAAATWVDQVAAVTLSKAASPTINTVSSPVFA